MASTKTPRDKAPAVPQAAGAVSQQVHIDGYVDRVDGEGVVGWAAVLGQPDLKIVLDVYEGSELLGSVIASGYRRDLALANVNHGFHGFSFPLPSVKRGVAINVRVSGTSIVLQTPTVSAEP